MLGRAFSEKIGIDPRVGVVNIILLVNAFTWYFYAFTVLKESIRLFATTGFQPLVIWSVNFVAMTVSAVFGATLMYKLKRRIFFLLSWMSVGIVLSLTPLILNLTTNVGVAIISAVFGAYFGIGMPICMGYYADSTVVGNRSRLGGITFLLTALGFFLLSNIGIGDIVIHALILAGWRTAGVAILLSLKPSEKPVENRNQPSFASIFSDQQFLLYFIPWCMFSLVNSMTFSVISNSEYFKDWDAVGYFLSMFEYILVGMFAVIGGFFADFFGRKRLAIIGFAMLGLGYGILGFYPESLAGWCFYTVADGVAWGAFSTIFFLTLWGDLAPAKGSEKYYAIGGLPYLFANFMRLSIGSDVAKAIPNKEAVFPYASFFLFLAVLPLMIAPETLPEKKIKERELKHYIEKAKKVREKYA